MKKHTVSIIAAVGKNTRAIGKKNGLIWKIEGDLPRFKRLTLGHPIIMGKKTFASLPRALPGRTNIVLTRDGESFDGAVAAASLQEAFERAKKESADEIFVIGGGEIYAQSLPFADKLYLTVVESDEPGDTFFPDYSEFKTVLSEERHGEHNPAFTYLELTR